MATQPDVGNMATAAALNEPTMQEKRTALADLVEGILTNHDNRFKVENRVRDATLDGRDRKDRNKLMGKPTRYCEIDYAGRVSEGLDGMGRALAPAHSFKVSLWYGFNDTPKYATSSQKGFDDACESRDATTPGLMHALDFQNYLIAGPNGTACQMGQPVIEEAPTLVALSLDNEWAHFVTFTLSIL